MAKGKTTTIEKAAENESGRKLKAPSEGIDTATSAYGYEEAEKAFAKILKANGGNNYIVTSLQELSAKAFGTNEPTRTQIDKIKNGVKSICTTKITMLYEDGTEETTTLARADAHSLQQLGKSLVMFRIWKPYAMTLIEDN